MMCAYIYIHMYDVCIYLHYIHMYMKGDDGCVHISTYTCIYVMHASVMDLCIYVMIWMCAYITKGGDGWHIQKCIYIHVCIFKSLDRRVSNYVVVNKLFPISLLFSSFWCGVRE